MPSNDDPYFETIEDITTTSFELEIECEVMYSFKVQVVNDNGQGANTSSVTVNECSTCKSISQESGNAVYTSLTSKCLKKTAGAS